MTATDYQDLSTLFPSVTHIQDDTGVSPAKSGHGYLLGSSVKVDRVVHVGDVICFNCQGVDPRGRELAWWLHPYGYDPTPRTVGNQVELRWTVGVESIGERAYLGIGMAADAEYHREGGIGAQVGTAGSATCSPSAPDDCDGPAVRLPIDLLEFWMITRGHFRRGPAAEVRWVSRRMMTD